jgi:DNA-binding NarL/FixJ family response regulator
VCLPYSNLPQLGETELPRPMDVARGVLLYNDPMERVYLADAQTQERAALRLMLLDFSLQVVGEAADWLTTLVQAPATHPDMVVVDWDPLANGSGMVSERTDLSSFWGHYRLEPKTGPGQPVVYQIRIKGHLDSQWTDWFGGLFITLVEDGDTLLTGPVIDQAALHGLLKKVRDLGMPLGSVSLLEHGQADQSDVQ